MKELLLLSGLGMGTLLLEIFNLRKLILPIVIIGLLVNVGFCIYDYNQPQEVYQMLFLDNTALFITAVLSFCTACWFIMNLDLKNDEHSLSDHTSLVLFSLVGAFIISSYINLFMLFIGIEILSIPLYVLAGSNKRNIYSNEAAYKYLIIGAFISSFLLLGITFLYGATGSFDIRQIAIGTLNPKLNAQLYLIGVLLIFFSISFKSSIAPFHFWAPDVYSGSPTRVTAFMVTIVKVAALAAFLRFFIMALGIVHQIYANVILTFALLSIIFANLIGTVQQDVKKLMAYSGITHAGFVFLGMAFNSPNTSGVILYYLASYAFTGIALFWVIVELSKQGINEIDGYKGLVKKNPLLAFTLILSLLSMAGIPPMAGFFAKYLVLVQVITLGKVWIAIVAIIASLISVYYYFKLIIISVQTAGIEENDKIILNLLSKITLVVLNLLIIGMGIFANYIINLI